jgi:flagellar assembly protein FliH
MPMMTSRSDPLPWDGQAHPGSAQPVSKLLFSSIETPEELTVAGGTEDPQEAALREHITALQQQLATQAQATAAHLEETHQRGRRERESELAVALEQTLKAERASIARVEEAFTQERTRYFAAVEMEVVKLSLAIAARILHREAALEPLLLAGAVHVALGKIQDGGKTTLRVPPEDLAAWKTRFEDICPNLSVVPEQQLELGSCLLESPVGTVDFGVAAQLAEIERGFFDLLQRRPA